MSVNKERVQLLVNALRSGEYQQAAGHLRLNGRYCCLGVATKIALEGGCEIPPSQAENREPWNQNHQIMCPAVYQWYGFTEGSPQLLRDDTGHFTDSAVTLNDNYGWNFNKIADAFERTFLRETAAA